MLIFISYSSKDRPFALRLRDHLHASGQTVWFDVDNIAKGADWTKAIDDGLAACDAMVAVFSPNSVESINCTNEWNATLSDNKPFIPLLFAECKPGHRFRTLNYIDCQTNESRGFADLDRALVAPTTQSPVSQPTQVKAVPQSDVRSILLDKGQQFWIKGVLEKNTVADLWVDLAADARPSAVEPIISRTVENPDYGSFTLGSTNKIEDVFRRSGRALLILGAPGSGKTMTLLELARGLMAEAEEDSTQPIPLVLNLASWAAKPGPRLEEWVADQLHLEYGLARKLATSLTRGSELLLLLDGLDEVPKARRAACVQAINDYWRRANELGDTGLVVCSRIAEYEALREVLNVQNAITLRALSKQQVETYLENLGEAWAGLREAIAESTALQIFIESPLLLNLMAVAYRKQTKAEILVSGDNALQKNRLLNMYITRRLKEGQRSEPFEDDQQTRHFLAWLAARMSENEMIVFQIERLQPDWLPKVWFWLWVLLESLISGVLFGAVIALLGDPLLGLGVGTLVGLISLGILGWWKFAQMIVPVDVLHFSLRNYWPNLLHNRKEVWLLALGFGLVTGLFFGIGQGTLLGVSGGSFFGLFAGLLVGLASGLEPQSIEINTSPNQGIRNSFRNGKTLGLIFGIVFGLVFLVGFGPKIGLICAIFAAIMGGGFFGGGRVVAQHMGLRLILFLHGVAPRNYTKFLQYTTERGLSRQVGNGFVFRHRMLMEHFAESEW